MSSANSNLIESMWSRILLDLKTSNGTVGQERCQSNQTELLVRPQATIFFLTEATASVAPPHSRIGKHRAAHSVDAFVGAMSARSGALRAQTSFFFSAAARKRA